MRKPLASTTFSPAKAGIAIHSMAAQSPRMAGAALRTDEKLPRARRARLRCAGESLKRVIFKIVFK
jgi:hypothetical protein